jgi:hypothetical protein
MAPYIHLINKIERERERELNGFSSYISYFIKKIRVRSFPEQNLINKILLGLGS